MMVRVVGKLGEEDLNRWRAMVARVMAIEVRPDIYSATEIEQAYLSRFRFCAELCERYGIDDTYQWNISNFTGVIWEGEITPLDN